LANGSFAVNSSHTYLSGGTYTYTVGIFDKGTGQFPYIPAATASSTVTVQGSTDFTLGNGGAGPVNAGQTAGPYNIAVNTMGFNGTLNFSCSGLPQGATCIFAPMSLTISGQPTGTTLTIATTGPAQASLMSPRPAPAFRGLFTFWFAGPMLGIVSLRSARRKKGMRLRILAIIVLLLLVTVFSSCGGGGGSPPLMHSNQTPTGVYMVTVSAASTGAQATTTVTLTVN
jgi:hypothetical protein